jgi:hypothetical protein
MPSKPALTKTTTHDDGTFIRTAIVLDASKNAEVGSIDLVTPDGKRIAQVNVTLYPDGSLILDTIDTEKRWGQARAFLFAEGKRELLTSTVPGSLVSADFRIKGAS